MASEAPNLDPRDPVTNPNDHHDDSDSANESENDLDGIGQSSVETININTKYQPGWGGGEAFREYYQNFKDAIIRSFDLSESDFCPEKREYGREILIRVFHPTKLDPVDDSRLLCGYIRFRYDGKHEGTLEITNFNANLFRWHLGFGGTSKATQENQAGQHGEGMKLATLIMRRHPQNHSVRFQASKFSWSFGFNTKKILACTLKRINQEKIAEEKARDRRRKKSRNPRILEAHSWEDVSIIIGEARNSRTVAGEMKKSQKIRLETFQQWLGMTIDISPPKSIIRTALGNILLDVRYRNKFYLHGLLLSNERDTAMNFRYGYCLFEGRTGRDHEALGTSDELTRKITSIWSRAILMENRSHAEKIEILGKYTELLEKFKNAADILQAEKYIPKEVAELLLAYLHKRNPALELRPFFHKYQESNEINKICCMRRTPIKINHIWWRIMSQHCKFKPITDVYLEKLARLNPIQPETRFASHMIAALIACIQTLPGTISTIFSPIDPGLMDFDVILHGSKWLVNNKFLDYEGVHEIQGTDFCGMTYDENTDVFNCDHALDSLLRPMLQVLDKEFPNILSTLVDRVRYVKKLRRKLQLMPRGLKFHSTGTTGELIATWITVTLPPDSNLPVRAYLHSGSCSKFGQIPQRHFILKKKECDCSCSYVAATLGSGRAHFTNLRVDERYTLMISHDEEDAFYALPPHPVSPSTADLTLYKCSSPKTMELSKGKSFFQSVLELPSNMEISDTNLDGFGKDVTFSQLQPDALPWSQNFPGGYEWFKAEEQDNDVYIALSKAQSSDINRKRASDGIEEFPDSKRSCLLN